MSVGSYFCVYDYSSDPCNRLCHGLFAMFRVGFGGFVDGHWNGDENVLLALTSLKRTSPEKKHCFVPCTELQSIYLYKVRCKGVIGYMHYIVYLDISMSGSELPTITGDYRPRLDVELNSLYIHVSLSQH